MATGVQPSSLQFAGQVAIVTGGAQGLGEGIVKMLVENGCSVMIFDMNLEKATALADSLRTKGYTVECCRVDVSDEQSVLEGFAALRAKFDRLDIMVNCAGIVGPNAIKTAEVKAEDFDRVYKGTEYCYQELGVHDKSLLHMYEPATPIHVPSLASQPVFLFWGVETGWLARLPSMWGRSEYQCS